MKYFALQNIAEKPYKNGAQSSAVFCFYSLSIQLFSNNHNFSKTAIFG